MREWTSSQLEAIGTRGVDMLVSAAAGSGKTSALTERIVRAVEDGADIGRILIVTFSRASAADMKKKLADALRERAESTGSARLLRQCARLGDASVGTIHSFCYSLVKKHHELLHLPPRLRVPDEAESAQLRRECMEETIDAMYADGMEAASILTLSDHIGGGRGDGVLADTLLTLYAKTSCRRRRHRVIADSAEAAVRAGVDGFLDTAAGKAIKRRVADGLRHYIAIMSAAVEELPDFADFGAKYAPVFEYSRDRASAILSSVESGDYDGTAAAIAAYKAELPRLPAVRGKEKPPRVAFFCEARTALGKFVADAGDEYFTVPRGVLESSIAATADVCGIICRVLDKFDERLAAEKRRRAVVDYDDLERFACELLSRRDVSAEVGREYDEICIDEYQDVNGVQDAIFTAIAGAGRTRFMVGDVKQSIYGFRGAEPSLFDSYRHTIKTVLMSENFRCDRAVVDFTNAVCGRLLPFGNVTYERRDALVYAKSDADGEIPARVVVTTRSREPEAVADMIEKAIADGVEPDKIAILLRSAKSRGTEFADALGQRRVPVRNDAAANFFESPEILLMLCLLHVCDNPLYDVYMAGALRSPAFGFSLDELVRIKSGDERPIYHILRDAESGGALDDKLAARCRAAYETVRGWRARTRTMTSDEAVRFIADETGVETQLWSEGNGGATARLRADNVAALYEYARGFESGGYRGLYRFLEYVDTMIEGGVNNPVSASSDKSEVRIMTIHQSKGLEFELVILAGCGALRNERDSRASVLYSASAGAAMKLRADPNSTLMNDTLWRRGVAAAISDENAAEEMRILYVALTRARSRLVVTAGVDDPERVVGGAAAAAEFFSAHAVRSERTMIGWILSALSASGYDGYELEIDAGAPDGDSEVIAAGAAAAESDAGSAGIAVDAERTAEYAEEIRRRLLYRYPYERIGALPAKLSVSRLEPNILDEDAVSFSAESESAPTPSALAGTATHIFMQFCDFARAAEDAGAECERLCALGYMTREDAGRVRIDEVERFFKSDLYRRITDAAQVWRERRFNVRLPASDFTESESDRELYRGEELLVQGVVDCFFRDRDGGITLVDYKTDRLSPYELSHRGAAEKVLTARHSRQLSYYRAALASIFGAPPAHVLIYSMHLGDSVELRFE